MSIFEYDDQKCTAHEHEAQLEAYQAPLSATTVSFVASTLIFARNKCINETLPSGGMQLSDGTLYFVILLFIYLRCRRMHNIQ